MAETLFQRALRALEDAYYAISPERRARLIPRIRAAIGRKFVPDHQALKDFDAHQHTFGPRSLANIAQTNQVRYLYPWEYITHLFRGVDLCEFMLSYWLVCQTWLPGWALRGILVALAYDCIDWRQGHLRDIRLTQGVPHYISYALELGARRAILGELAAARVGNAREMWKRAEVPPRIDLLPWAMAALFLFGLLWPSPVQAGVVSAAISAACVWELRTTGNVQSGGGFVAGASGTDFSQQDATQFALTGVTSAGAGNVVLSASAAASMVGNVGYVVSGTNFTAGTVTAFFAVTAVTVGVSITFSTNVAGTAICTGVGADGVINIGGANTDPAILAANLVAGQSLHQKAGTYSITSATINVAGGCPSVGVRVSWEGYQTTRSDLGTKPLFQASGISTATLLVTTTNDISLRNLACDGASLTAIRGVSGVSARTVLSYVSGLNCTNSGLFGAGRIVFGSATGCATQPAIASTGMLLASIAYDNTISGISVGAGLASFCIADSNSGATSDGLFSADNETDWVNCTSYNSGQDGVGNSSRTSTLTMNCLAESNGRYGYNGTGIGAVRIKCGAYNNTSGADNHTAASLVVNQGFITGTASFFVDAAAGNFALNTLAGGGALARAAGIPGIFPGGLTTGYLDVGAAQHADPAGGGGGSVAAIFGG